MNTQLTKYRSRAALPASSLACFNDVCSDRPSRLAHKGGATVGQALYCRHP